MEFLIRFAIFVVALFGWRWLFDTVTDWSALPIWLLSILCALVLSCIDLIIMLVLASLDDL